jgi:hypothetical protein
MSIRKVLAYFTFICCAFKIKLFNFEKKREVKGQVVECAYYIISLVTNTLAYYRFIHSRLKMKVVNNPREKRGGKVCGIESKEFP